MIRYEIKTLVVTVICAVDSFVFSTDSERYSNPVSIVILLNVGEDDRRRPFIGFIADEETTAMRLEYLFQSP